MMNARIVKTLKTASILLVLPLICQAAPTPPPSDRGRSEMREVNLAFLEVVAALAVVMIAINALRYVTSDNPQERADIKKSLTYVVIGLIIVYLARALVKGIYCYALYKAWGIATTECEKYI